jgi:patatin-like phospholipase/acyl hydrolase
MENVSEKFQILSLSGGGYRGLYTAAIIAKIEEDTGKPFASHFDLIAGTSIGGIIALALALHIPAKTIVGTLIHHGPDIFSPIKRWPWPFSLRRGILRSKHSSEELKSALESLFGDKTIADLNGSMLVTAVNWTQGKAQMFKKHGDFYSSDAKRSLVDVGLATSAAPVYLPNHKMDNQIYVDGGIAGNAPGIFAFHEAAYIQEQSIDSLYMLSIGTLSLSCRADQGKTLKKGIFQWGADLIELIMTTQERNADDMLKHILRDRYIHIDDGIHPNQQDHLKLDVATETATETLLGMADIAYRNIKHNPSLTRFFTHHEITSKGHQNDRKSH